MNLSKHTDEELENLLDMAQQINNNQMVELIKAELDSRSSTEPSPEPEEDEPKYEMAVDEVSSVELVNKEDTPDEAVNDEAYDSLLDAASSATTDEPEFDAVSTTEEDTEDEEDEAESEDSGLVFKSDEDLGYQLCDVYIEDPDTGEKHRADEYVAGVKDGDFNYPYNIKKIGWENVPHEHLRVLFNQGIDEGLWREVGAEEKPYSTVLYGVLDDVHTISGDTVEVGFQLMGSVDSTTAQAIRGFILINHRVGVIGRHLGELKRKHTKSVVKDMDLLKVQVNTITEDLTKMAQRLQAFANEPTANHIDVLEDIKEALPYKQLPSYFGDGDTSIKQHRLPATFWDVYKDVAESLWKSDLKEQSKLTYSQQLDKALRGLDVYCALGI